MYYHLLDICLNLQQPMKGCMAGRYQTPGNLSPNSEMFKDKNFEDELIILGEDKYWFLKQVKTKFIYIKTKFYGNIFYKLFFRLKEMLIFCKFIKLLTTACW